MKAYTLLRQLCLILSVSSCPLKSCFTLTVGHSLLCTLGGIGSLPHCVFSATIFSLCFSLSNSEEPVRDQILLKTHYYQRKDYTARWDREISMKTLHSICLVMLWGWTEALLRIVKKHLCRLKQDYSNFCLLLPGLWLPWEAVLIYLPSLKTALLSMGCLCGGSD